MLWGSDSLGVVEVWVQVRVSLGFWAVCAWALRVICGLLGCLTAEDRREFL